MRILLPVILTLLLPLTVNAQAEPESLPALATQVAADLAEAERAVDQAFNLLGLLESFGLIVTVVGGVGVIFGVTRFFSAQNQLRESRQSLRKSWPARGVCYRKRRVSGRRPSPGCGARCRARWRNQPAMPRARFPSCRWASASIARATSAAPAPFTRARCSWTR